MSMEISSNPDHVIGMRFPVPGLFKENGGDAVLLKQGQVSSRSSTKYLNPSQAARGSSRVNAGHLQLDPVSVHFRKLVFDPIQNGFLLRSGSDEMKRARTESLVRTSTAPAIGITRSPEGSRAGPE